jgi:hypothetical protein
MIKGEESRRMSSLLRFGFLADRALIALSDVDPDRPHVTKEDLMSSLADFLDSTAQSFATNGPHQPMPGAGAGARAVAYLDWDTIASIEEVQDGERFVQRIAQLREVVECVNRGEPVSKEDLQRLKSFLTAVGRLSLTQAQALRQSAESGKARESWQLASRR